MDGAGDVSPWRSQPTWRTYPMSYVRRTLCALAVVSAPFGSLYMAGSALADAPAPSVASVDVNGQDLATDGSGHFYSNDPVDPDTGQTQHAFTITVDGDRAATEVTLSVLGGGSQTATPDEDGDATFPLGTLPPDATTLSVGQTVGGETTAQTNYILVGN